MTDALTLSFSLSLLALLSMLWMPHWREFPALRWWAVLQLFRLLVWFTHRTPLIDTLYRIFPVVQLLVVAECVWRAGYLLPKGKRGGFHAWCWLVGAGVALMAVAQSPMPYPMVTRFQYELHLALHVLALATLLASLAYTWLISRSHDALGTRVRLAWVLYLTASVAADRVHDPALYDAYTVFSIVAQTIAVIVMIGAFMRYHPWRKALIV